MLTPPNEALAARDPALPGLSLLLDREALADALGTQGVELRHLRYKPGTSCTAAVETAEGHWLRLRALTPPRFAESARAAGAPLASVCIEASSPADDGDVPGLRRLWPEATRGKAIARLFREDRLATARLSPLSYRLGRRLVARLDHHDGAALLKLHAPQRFAQAQAGALAGAMLGHGRLERACAQRFAVVSRWVPGKPLCARSGMESFAAAGAALAALHRARVLLPFTRGRAEEIAAAERVLSDARHLLPGMEARLVDASRRLAVALAAAPAEPGVIHGDFSADQVVMADEGPCFIDWDRAGMGDRAADLGSALARLDAEHLWHGLPGETARAARDALCSGYSKHRALPEAVEAQRLIHLARLLAEPFRSQHDDWPERMRVLLAEVERGLDRLHPSALADPALPQLATICAPAGAQALLDATIGDRLVAPPRLLRHKPGRRALVEIPAAGPQGPRTWLAKTRSKRPDHATPALHAALRAAGFDGRPGAAFGVAEMRAGPEGMRACLMARVPGRPLSDWLSPEADPAPFHAAGSALATLHAAPVEPGRAWSGADELAVVDRALSAAAAQVPGAADTIARLRERAARLCAQAPSMPPVLLHRDFYPDQALVDGSCAWLIDLDLAARGDRHVDLGNMLAHLAEFGLRRFGRAGALDAQAASFLAGYGTAGGTWSTQALRDMLWISLLRHLHICLQLGDRSHVFPELLVHLSPPSPADAPSVLPQSVDPGREIS